MDFDKLRLILGDEVEDGEERYAFTWPGKRDAIRQSQIPSTATLRPCEEESVAADGTPGSWEGTQNLYIEGDNLEVLKLLQRAYCGKVKMIYIDPPYNTGHDFVYKDSFGDTLENYKKLTGTATQSNPEMSGRFHADWCSMMYSRLRLARELLEDSGVIFISIDDNEDKNLRALCDEVFGEANFIAQLVWERAYSPKNDAKYISNSHDYILMFAKNVDRFEIGRLPRTDEANARYTNLDGDPRGPWKPSDMSVKSYSAASDYPITTPSGRIVKPPAGRCWRLSKKAFFERLQDERIWFGPNGDGVPCIKRFLSELKFSGMAPQSILFYKEVGHSQEGAKEVVSLFGGKGYFDGPKPVRLMKRLITLSNLKPDSLVLDFFSGSASLADALMQVNSEEQIACKFIMVQLPERTNESKDAFKDGYTTICEIGKERIRRAGKQIAAEVAAANHQLHLGEEPKQLPDIGFRVFKLDESGIATAKPGEFLLDRVKDGRSEEDIIFEMMLKWGLELTYPVEKTKVAGYPCYTVAGDALICCMQPGLTMGVIEAIAELAPDRVFVLDSVLDDTVKLNMLQTFKRVEELTQHKIDLRTV